MFLNHFFLLQNFKMSLMILLVWNTFKGQGDGRASVSQF